MFSSFYWVPYFKGKRLRYYEYFALVGSTVMLLLSIVCYFIYLQIRNCSRRSQLRNMERMGSGFWEKFFYKASLISLSTIPLVCSATETINTTTGMLGMMAILTYMLLTKDRGDLTYPTEPEKQPLVQKIKA